MGKLLRSAFTVLVAGMVMVTGLSNPSKAEASSKIGAETKKAIVVVSFGTTFPESRKACIESVENKIQQSFPDYEVRRAFTSTIVVKRIQENENIHIDSLEQALDKLKQEGFSEVIVQTTHLTPGEEYDKKVVAVVAKYGQAFDKIVIGRPVLYFHGENGQPDDFAAVVKALRSQMPLLQKPDRAVVFMGHGSPHQPNPAYGALQERFDAAGLNVVVGVVEESDHPNFEDVKKALEDRKIKKVVLMPLMLVAGDHANNDMAGDESDSWKNQLIDEGLQVETYIHGLGENPAFQDIYVQHVRDAISGIHQ
ncbi:MAG TPA: sirohydrochlorin cobaltochelatase [Selenomonadales bacterium]|nr:sirohydrochlorin cobaltochelatase [Selenomonadales bacterium]